MPQISAYGQKRWIGQSEAIERHSVARDWEIPQTEPDRFLSATENMTRALMENLKAGGVPLWHPVYSHIDRDTQSVVLSFSEAEKTLPR